MTLRGLVLSVLLTLGLPLAASADVVPPDAASGEDAGETPGTDAGGTPGTDAGSGDGGGGGCAVAPTGGAAFAIFGALAGAALLARRARR
ncbi:MAG: hypothetical protein KF729_24740 [Sandaracinaceae bacterium]|nr:hypothetical protein [Sandaracinaceae bacterium]